jgi:hypothetical protein
VAREIVKESFGWTGSSCERVAARCGETTPSVKRNAAALKGLSINLVGEIRK